MARAAGVQTLGDQPGVGGRLVVRPGGRRSLGAGAVPQLGGGDGADREGGHDQHEVPQDRGVEQVIVVPGARVRVKDDATRST